MQRRQQEKGHRTLFCLGTWLRALRLQFYPLSWLAYTLGASLMLSLGELWKSPAYWIGYVVIFMVEALTVFINELYDFESDLCNTNHGPFTGGARLLVDGSLQKKDLIFASTVAGCLTVVASVGLLLLVPISSAGHLVCLGATAIFLGIGYTMPPVKLSHRGWGEVTVAFVHSLLVVQVGALVMGKSVGEGGVFHVSLPVFFAIFPSITFAGLPDREVDSAAGKRTLAVKFGTGSAILISCSSALAAAGLAWWWSAVWPPWALMAMSLHTCVLVGVAYWSTIHKGRSRIDVLLAISLTYVFWFVLVPLFSNRPSH